MINIQKHMDFFDPTELEAQVHLIGCGAIGSHLAEQMARLGSETELKVHAENSQTFMSIAGAAM